jgi:cbb3-type cytochrome oxidase maturation protein
MDIIIALVFISLTLVIAGLVFFFSRLAEGDFEHGERLSLLPLADDDGMGDDKEDIKDSNANGPPEAVAEGPAARAEDREQ